MSTALKVSGSQQPSTFAAWKGGGKKLFENGDTPTNTHVFNVETDGEIDPNRRRAVGWFGKTCRFYIEMSKEEGKDEDELKEAHRIWALEHGGEQAHTYLSDAPGDKPPGCGSPGGPPC